MRQVEKYILVPATNRFVKTDGVYALETTADVTSALELIFAII